MRVRGWRPVRPITPPSPPEVVPARSGPSVLAVIGPNFVSERSLAVSLIDWPPIASGPPERTPEGFLANSEILLLTADLQGIKMGV